MDKPVYSLDVIEFQIQTSWGAGYPFFEGWPLGDVTYAIAADLPLQGDSQWEAMTAGQVTAARNAFSLWNELVGSLRLVEVSDPATADITFSYSAARRCTRPTPSFMPRC